MNYLYTVKNLSSNQITFQQSNNYFNMRKIFLTVTVAFFATMMAYPCTNFLASRGATVDGSTMITYSADAYFFFGSMHHSPAATHAPGSMRRVYDWHTREFRGEISQVERTYSVIGNMNEHQVVVAESTFGGRPELVNPEGLIDYGSLKYITLERARTAREAIYIMTTLVATYGYGSSGESFSIGDPNEVWIMELIGKGPGRKGAVWVAKRIPDGYVSAHANHARITTFPQDGRYDGVLFHPEVITFAREMGFFDGRDEDFSFSDVYAPIDFRALFFCEARVWAFFRQLNPEMEEYFSYVIGETKRRMPLWIRPVEPVSVRDFKRLMRDQYEGTPLDVMNNMAAGPFRTKLRLPPLTFEVDGVQWAQPRPIATQQSGWTFVAQMRNWLPNHVGGIMWFGSDDAVSTVYIPMFVGSMPEVPWAFSIDNGSMLQFSNTSAFWIFNKVANFAYSRWALMFPEIQRVQQRWEDYFHQVVPAIEQVALAMPEAEARAFLSQFSLTQTDAVMDSWSRLFEFLLVKFLDGAVRSVDENGRFIQNRHGVPLNADVLRPGYPEWFLRKMVENNQNFRVLTQEELDNRIDNR
jgi:dipeptidase